MSEYVSDWFAKCFLYVLFYVVVGMVVVRRKTNHLFSTGVQTGCCIVFAVSRGGEAAQQCFCNVLINFFFVSPNNSGYYSRIVLLWVGCGEAAFTFLLFYFSLDFILL